MVLLPPPWYFVASAIVLEIFIILFVLSTVRSHELFSKKKRRRRRKMKKRLREKRWEYCSLLYCSTRGIYTTYRGLGPALERGGVKPRTKGKMSKENAVVWTSLSGRKNVLRKLLRIPYRRLKAGFSVCWLCLFVAGVLREMHGVRTFAPCKAFLFDMFAFFRRLKITLDLEQPMLKEKWIILSVWGGIKGFEHF